MTSMHDIHSKYHEQENKEYSINSTYSTQQSVMTNNKGVIVLQSVDA
eukprot:CAMPEP_0197081072 /NCGR_PEP_ID=MMETSP1384-20130603/214452_1 /TAXON_ID=29189 /ORGANISM="Ammonia sp." /LENGTH=46 /DNA_ID= /DNA_START= /DNA_END= /DNA_ORIENTATION=